MKAVDAVHVIFAGERVNDLQVMPNPTLDETAILDGLRVIGLAELVCMKLDAWRTKDRMHLARSAECRTAPTWVGRGAAC